MVILALACGGGGIGQVLVAIGQIIGAAEVFYQAERAVELISEDSPGFKRLTGEE